MNILGCLIVSEKELLWVQDSAYDSNKVFIDDSQLEIVEEDDEHIFHDIIWGRVELQFPEYSTMNYLKYLERIILWQTGWKTSPKKNPLTF